MPAKTVDKKQKALEFFDDFSVITKNWVSRYDTENDSFYLTVPKLSDDARLGYVGVQLAFYFTKDNDVEGIFIEYFKTNFVKHHGDFRDLLQEIKDEQKKANSQVLLKLKQDEVNRFKPEFKELLKSSLAENLELHAPA